jgi:hypothetical protein
MRNNAITRQNYNHFDWILLVMATEEIGRVMMSTELSAKGLLKTIVPSVYREDYMGAFKNLTRERLLMPM